MAKQRNPRETSGGRGSPEAVEKRRAARRLNTLITGGARATAHLDGRTEKRRKRLIRELKEGRRGVALKPIDVVTHVNELMELGETLRSIKRQGVKARKLDLTPDIIATAERTQAAYGFDPDAWKMLGIDLGNLDKTKKPRTRAAKSKTRKG